MVITLIGYRGTGKSTVGRALADRLGWECVDTDPLIEQRIGKPIARIFAEEGEPFFRELERNVLAEELGRSEIVLSVGGGAILDEQSRREMRQAGPVVWLRASVETIISRLSTDPETAARRPSLTGSDPRSEVATVLAGREPLYADAATLTIDTGGRDVTSIVDEIVEQIDVQPRIDHG